MKFVLTLFAVLAVIGLGQARPEFDSDPYIAASVPTAVEKELLDFVQLIPTDKVAEIVMKYVNEDEKVRNAVLFLVTPDFHTLLRDVEALKEHQAMVVYLESLGLRVAFYIQKFHEAIGMEDYVPPKMKTIFESEIGIQKIGDGLKGMFEDITKVLPLDKIEALYKNKMQNSKVFSEFINKLISKQTQTLINNLYANQTYKNFVLKSREKGLEFEEMKKLTAKIFGLKFPY